MKRISSRRLQVLARRRARGLKADGKNWVWETMGLKLTRTETRAFQEYIQQSRRRYGFWGAIDHLHDFKPYDRACKRIDAIIARRNKYARDKEGNRMTIEDCKRILKSLDFTVATGDMVLRIGNEQEIRTPIIAVKVSPAHHCLDPQCDSYHLIGTSHAIAQMSEGALRAMISDELWGNR